MLEIVKILSKIEYESFSYYRLGYLFVDYNDEKNFFKNIFSSGKSGRVTVSAELYVTL
jgi:hypothetical protein